MSGASRPAGPAAVTGPAAPAVYQGSRPLPASPVPSVALLGRFPPRPVPASWVLTSQPKPQVLGKVLAPPFPTGRANLDQERRRGLIRVLDWLEAQPGDTWQDRWITSGADAAGNPAWRGLLAGWLAATGRGPRDPEHVSLLAGRAIMLLICADVIRPSLGWLLAPATPAGLSAEMARVRDPAGFAALAAAAQAAHVNSHTTQLALRRIAAILAAKGGPVADITIGDCLELLQIAGELLRSSDATSPYFYQLLRAAGIFGEAAPPGRALRTQGQLGCEQLIDRYGIECRPVRDLLVDYLRERQPAVDYPTLHKLSYVLGRLFWRDLELHHPGIASLHLPAEAAAAWKQRITTKTTRSRSAGGDITEANASRVNAFDHLVTVRAFYLDLAQWAADDPARWGPGPRRARSATPTSPGAAKSDPAASRGWTSGPASASPSSPRCWPRWTRTGRQPPDGCAPPGPPRPASCSPWPARPCAGRPGPTPQQAGPGRKIPAAARTATSPWKSTRRSGPGPRSRSSATQGSGSKNSPSCPTTASSSTSFRPPAS